MRLLVIALLFTAAVVSAAELCDYWIMQESNAGGYSKLNLTSLGLQTHRTISVNGDDFGAGKTMPFENGTLSKVPMGLVEYTNATFFTPSLLKSLIIKRMVPRINGGQSSTNVIVLDLEYPFPWVHPCEYGTLNQSTLAAVVKATRTRIHVIRQVFPNAGLALYSTAGCTDPTALKGYERAAALGLFDELTHLVPVLYMGAKTIATKVAFNGLNASLACQPHGRSLPMLPLFTWLVSRKSGGKFYACSLAFDRLHNEMRAVLQWASDHPENQIAAMAFWTPSDDSGSGPTRECGRNSRQMSYAQWLAEARIVPRDCPHNLSSLASSECPRGLVGNYSGMLTEHQSLHIHKAAFVTKLNNAGTLGMAMGMVPVSGHPVFPDPPEALTCKADGNGAILVSVRYNGKGWIGSMATDTKGKSNFELKHVYEGSNMFDVIQLSQVNDTALR